MDISTAVASVPRSALYVAVAPFALAAFVLSLIRIYTTWKYYRTVQHFIHNPTAPGKKNLESPQIPYTLPYLGNSLQFLDTHPGKFYNKLFSWHPRSTGVCTLLIGGKKTHILFCPAAVQAMFKNWTMSRDVFEQALYQKVFQFSDEQLANTTAGKHMEHEMNSQYLTKHDRVNELTAHFTRVLDEVFTKDAQEIVNKDSVLLYDWLRDRMFTASTTALMGEELLKMYPAYCKDFFDFDQEFLKFLFDLPKFMIRDATARRERIIKKLEEWSKLMHEQSGGTPIDPEGPAWEPLMGSRLNRARQLDYKNRKLNSRSAAALDLGITFALSSNVIPATAWMLMNILNPKGDPTILGRVTSELKKAEKLDGSVDIPTLVGSALLQSIWTETLRLYTDVLVTRNLSEDTTLPLDDDGKTFVQMRKGDNVFAPCWLGQHDPIAWSGGEAPPERFYAERFLTTSPSGPAVQMFTMSSTTGKFFPFGGGKTICPGRVFAKQEALGALAMVLLKFEFQVIDFADCDGKATGAFPGFASAFPGSGALVPGGDLRVQMRRRESLN